MIVEAITLISTANAAIGAVKEMIGNGRDLMDCNKELGDYFSAKSEIQKQANPSGSGSDLQAFLALEKLKQQEQELKEMMIYSGRGGMWDDWLLFQAEQKRKRDDQAKQILIAKTKRKKKIHDWIVGVLVSVAVLSGVGAIGVMFWWLANNARQVIAVLKWILVFILVQGDTIYFKHGGVFTNPEECEITRLMLPPQINTESVCVETDQVKDI